MAAIKREANASFSKDRNNNDAKKSLGLRHTDTSGCKNGDEKGIAY